MLRKFGLIAELSIKTPWIGWARRRPGNAENLRQFELDLLLRSDRPSQTLGSAVPKENA